MNRYIFKNFLSDKMSKGYEQVTQKITTDIKKFGKNIFKLTSNLIN